MNDLVLMYLSSIDLLFMKSYNGLEFLKQCLKIIISDIRSGSLSMGPINHLIISTIFQFYVHCVFWCYFISLSLTFYNIDVENLYFPMPWNIFYWYYTETIFHFKNWPKKNLRSKLLNSNIKKEYVLEIFIF